jgi:phosphotransacetylase
LIEDQDEKFEVYARIWNQFIRNKVVYEYILKRVDKDENYTGCMLVSTRQVS